MKNVFETSYTNTLIEFIKPLCFQGVFSQVLRATISASIIVFSLKKLHKYGFFSLKKELPTHWKKVGTIDKLFIYPIKGAKGLERNVGYFGPMGMKSEDGFHDRSFVLVDEKRYLLVIEFLCLAKLYFVASCILELLR